MRLQVLTVFFGSFIAGSLLNQIQSIIHNPTSLVHILGDAAPQVAVFFMTYLLLMVSCSCLSTIKYRFLIHVFEAHTYYTRF